MSKYLFVLARGPEDGGRVERCLRLARLAVLKGHEVSLFLMDEAVLLAQRFICSQPDKLPEVAPDSLCQHLQFLRKAKASILLDVHSTRQRLGARTALPSGLALMSDAAMLDLAEESKVFSF
ncbi:MAG: DsrE family protein [Desulfovibrio sp.]|nr:DsrE family protein [Desulfovibrio sp.]